MLWRDLLNVETKRGSEAFFLLSQATSAARHSQLLWPLAAACLCFSQVHDAKLAVLSWELLRKSEKGSSHVFADGVVIPVSESGICAVKRMVHQENVLHCWQGGEMVLQLLPRLAQ